MKAVAMDVMPSPKTMPDAIVTMYSSYVLLSVGNTGHPEDCSARVAHAHIEVPVEMVFRYASGIKRMRSKASHARAKRSRSAVTA